MAFDQGVVVKGAYRFCPTVPGGATVTTALTLEPAFFCTSDWNIHTSAHSLRFVVFVRSSLALALQR